MLNATSKPTNLIVFFTQENKFGVICFMPRGDSTTRRRSAPMKAPEELETKEVHGMTLRSGTHSNNSPSSSNSQAERGRRSDPFPKRSPAVSPNRFANKAPTLQYMFVTDRNQQRDIGWLNDIPVYNDETNLENSNAPYPEEDVMPGAEYLGEELILVTLKNVFFFILYRYLTGFVILFFAIYAYFYFPNNTKTVSGLEDYRIKLMDLSREYKLDQKEMAVIGEMLPIWARGGTMNPMVIVLYGQDEKLNAFYEKVLRWTSNVTRQRIASGFYCSETTSRAQLHKYFEDSLGGKSGPVFAAVRHLQELRWDAPVALHAWADDGHRLADHIFILLGIDGPPIVGDCEVSVTNALSAQWIKQGGNADAIPPIVHSRMHYFICL
ncbi:unnamed protein product, partial [Mesorhabditis belari]|uniref:Uncharacterized protein n=1 Tax=Mesorhabditis belari TaxID=2138241 RepID=A0AAF3EEL8_9BILA